MPTRTRSRPRLAEDRGQAIKAVCVVHNETSTGVTSRIAELRRAIDAAGHPALLMVDTISSLASIDYRQDEWGVDVTVAGSQKGLMLPPGLSFNGIGEKALAAHRDGAAAALLLGLGCHARGQPRRLFPVHAGHQPALWPARGDRACWSRRRGWRRCSPATTGSPPPRERRSMPGASRSSAPSPREYSSSLTAVRLPEGHDADALRRVILERFSTSLGNGLGKLQGRVFRIGHLGDFNEPMLAGTLAAVEMGLKAAGVPFRPGGVAAAMTALVADGPIPAAS